MNVEHDGRIRVEDDIDAALKMLGETQAPAALVSRVHRSLDVAAMSRSTRSSRRFLIPAAGVAMAAVALVAIHTSIHRTPDDQSSAVETARLVAATPPERATAVPPAAPVATKSFEEEKRSVQPPAVRRLRREHREYRHATNLLSYPLTQQEKLLLQFAHNAKPADLQALNPEYQAKLEAQQEAEFAAYLKSVSSSDRESATQTTEQTQE
jgi:hypothetical protein